MQFTLLLLYKCIGFRVLFTNQYKVIYILNSRWMQNQDFFYMKLNWHFVLGKRKDFINRHNFDIWKKTQEFILFWSIYYYVYYLVDDKDPFFATPSLSVLPYYCGKLTGLTLKWVLGMLQANTIWSVSHEVNESNCACFLFILPQYLCQGVPTYCQG